MQLLVLEMSYRMSDNDVLVLQKRVFVFLVLQPNSHLKENVISASFAQEYLCMLKSSGFAFTVRVTQFAWLYGHGKKALSSETRTNNKAMHNFYVALFEKNNKNCALKRERLSTVGWISLIWAIFVELHRMCKEKCE
ncbi:hypothetical protein T4B_13217 [Trichinella pseudospiralis]|uniref:Uncharacterized protein n=1 Tax=Trichinella pseudospiralis TaxID=6337 RepID=A0A0V1J8X6_TRIPS|nr:hypothetical protein T4B_13217 [Trichinella pseudospiralis]